MSILRERLVQSLLLFALLCALIGPLRPHGYLITSGTDERRFWTLKTLAQGECDLALAGDSRTYCGLAPAAMRPELPGLRIGNLGFAGVGLCKSYLELVQRSLDPAAPRRAVLLGVTPHSLTRRACEHNSFAYYAQIDPLQRWANLHAGRLLSLLEPLDLNFQLLALHGPRPRHFHEFHDDGWVGCGRAPEDPSESLPGYGQRLERSGLDQGLIDALLKQVSAWREQGIMVFGLRPPSTQAMIELESAAGFDQAEFVRRFEQAGGVWINTDQTGFHSYDGSHLRADAAQALSAFVAIQIRAHLLR